MPFCSVARACWIGVLLFSGGQAQEPVPSLETDALFREVLLQANLSPQEVRFDRELFRYFFRTEPTTPLFEMMVRDPLRLPYYAERVRNGLVVGVGRPAQAMEIGASLLGYSVRRTLVGNPLEPLRQKSQQPNAFTEAVSAIYQFAGEPIPNPVRQQLRDATRDLPEPFLQQCAFLIYTALEARKWRDSAFRELSQTEREALFRLFSQPHSAIESVMGSNSPNSEMALVLKVLEKVDFAHLHAGGHDCILVVSQVLDAVNRWNPELREQLRKPFEFNIDTPLGRIRLTGEGNDVHPRTPYLLLIDTAGDDICYGGGANLSWENAVSFLIDLEGSDLYTDDAPSGKTPIVGQANRATRGGVAFGGALMGYALLLDREGNDIYRTAYAGLGSGRFGVGVLIDPQGNDLYDGYVFTQGAGYAGIGMLFDREGNDQYFCFQRGQGFGGVKGFGLLLDATGGDTYTAHPKPLDFPSPQSAEHNVSLAQGSGYGRRADYSDGRSLAGGIGVLIDIQGDDRYLCGVFGQGTGYWGGVGLAIDLQGDDLREGVWYVQGASAHFAIGYLEDRLGNDRYVAGLNMAMGAGHDFGIGYLIDMDGNDEYDAPSLALGGANANGIGIFVDLKGDDLYKARSDSANFGRANPIGRGTLRERALALGIFLDTGGHDTYPPNLEFLGNGRQWIGWALRNERSNESQLGVGMDRE